MQRTELAELGEFGLIRHLTRGLPKHNDTTVLGVGDDAAIVAYPEGTETLVTTDLLLEGIHFDLTYTPLKHLGYKAAVSSFSDIYAMYGHPQQLTVSLGVSARFALEDLEELYAGLRLACDRYGVDLIGGDTSSSLTGLCLSITCLGIVAKGEETRRSGAQPTDLICVSGNLGAAFMGLQLLEREKRVFAGQTGDFDPDFAGREYILERQLRPEARQDIIRQLQEQGLRPTAMIDSSDGLASELLHLAKESGVGIRIYEERLPIDVETASMAEELGMSTTTVALSGGEDFELIFTLPLGELDRIRSLEGVHVIGHVTEAGQGCYLVTPDGAEIKLRAQGWPEEAEGAAATDTKDLATDKAHEED